MSVRARRPLHGLPLPAASGPSVPLSDPDVKSKSGRHSSFSSQMWSILGIHPGGALELSCETSTVDCLLKLSHIIIIEFCVSISYLDSLCTDYRLKNNSVAGVLILTRQAIRLGPI